jgi:hypothetical protein
MLRRSVKIDVTDIDSRSQWYAEGLDSPVQVHVKDGVLIVPDAGRGASHPVANEEDPIVAWIGLGLRHYCACNSYPGLDGRLHSHGVKNRRKIESRRTTADRELAIREIVKHVALVGMRLAPSVFKGGDIGGFAKIPRARVLSWDQVTRIHKNPV